MALSIKSFRKEANNKEAKEAEKAQEAENEADTKEPAQETVAEEAE